MRQVWPKFPADRAERPAHSTREPNPFPGPIYPEQPCPLRNGPCAGACPFALWRDTGSVRLSEPLGLGDLTAFMSASQYAKGPPLCGIAVAIVAVDTLAKGRDRS